MKTQLIGQTDLEVSRIALGCMRMASLDTNAAVKVINSSFDNGINFIDHADIYGGGESEITFAKALKETNISRDQLFIQSKCGIRQGYFDFSKEHIVTSVDGILTRLGMDYLDF